MALAIDDCEENVMSKITVDRRLWLTADKDALVEDGDPQAAFLWAVEGREMPKNEADRLGYKPARKSHQKDTEKPDEAPAEEQVECPVDGCDYVGTERGLKVHARSHDDE